MLRAVAIQADESIVLAGSTTGDWGGWTAGSDDFAALALDSDGREMWRWQVIRLEPYNRGANYRFAGNPCTNLIPTCLLVCRDLYVHLNLDWRANGILKNISVAAGSM